MAVKKGSFTVKSKIKDNLSGEEQESSDTGVIDIEVPRGEVAVVKSSTGMRLSMNYQSIGVDVGVEIPWPVKKGSLREDLDAGFKFAEELVDSKISDRVKEAKELLRRLGGGK